MNDEDTMPAVTGDDDLMTRYEVAMMFRVTSVAVAHWARRRSPLLTEIRNDQGRPRYKRSEVEALYASGFRGGQE